MIQKKKKLEKLCDIFKRFKLESINLSLDSAGIELSYTNWDAEAAWILYVELLTRIATQELGADEGIEITALESVHSIFAITRDVLRNYGKNAKSFTRIAVIVLNKIVRPFTSKWHPLSQDGAFSENEKKNEFRNDLSNLRTKLICYAKLLAEMANVDDLTEID